MTIGTESRSMLASTITRYVYDGEDILFEFDGSNALKARYTHGPGIDEPLLMDRSGSKYYYHSDGLGSITDLTDSTGAVKQSYVYDSFGQIVQTAGSVTNPYTYTGREFDSESGLYNYRFRYYDPHVGRFLQEDPIKSINPYPYADNNPLTFMDPWGFKSTVIGKVGEFTIQYETGHHGGTHLQIYHKDTLIGRFRLDGTPIEHKGKVPQMPSSVSKWLKKGGWITGLTFGLVGLLQGESLADVLDPFGADELYNEDIDENENGIPDWKEEYEKQTQGQDACYEVEGQ